MKKKPPKNPYLQVRVDHDLKKAFLDCAQANDRSGSILVRDFMREYVKKNNQRTLPL